MAVKVPMEYAGRAASAIRLFAQVKAEEWKGDGWYALLEIPARQLLFGTDYPQEIREGKKVRDFVAGIRTLSLPGETIQGILGEHGRGLLGL